MARRQSRAAPDDEDTELNMTPMLDVVFILLIFFIVTAVFVKEPGVDVQRPDAELDQRERPTILVAVTANDEIWIDRQVYQMNQVRNVIEQLRQQNPRAEAMIQGDQGAPIGTVLDVQDLLMQMDIDVTISTER
ncbi:biopolymer transporter ExbD [Glycocaulis profundi]|nr:biopolymer transporter ExbD [Glycocaulis profundi]